MTPEAVTAAPAVTDGRAPAADGRTARSRRTRRAVLDALEALIVDGAADIGARAVAARAGVSVRTVFAHFASLEDLHEELVARARDRVLALLRPIEPSAPLASRVRELCSQRGAVAEAIGPFRRLAALREGASPTLAAARTEGREASRAQVERVFAPELASLAPDARARLVAAVDALVSGESWDLLRAVHDLAPDEATTATAAAVTALLANGAGGEPDPDGGRRAEAQVLLADAEERIARLLAAVEAGAPADVVGPRLAALRAARDAAAAELGAAAGARPAG